MVDRTWLRSPQFLQRLAVTLLALVVYRIGLHIPLPMLELQSVPQQWGGVIARLSVMAIGVMPYFNAVILLELLRICTPALRRWLEASPVRRGRMMDYVVICALFFAVLQGFGLASAMEGVPGLVPEKGWAFRIAAATGLIGGALVAIFLCRIMDRHGLGQGLWLLLTMPAAIELVRAVPRLVQWMQQGSLSGSALAAVIALHVLAIMLLVLIAGGRGWIGSAGGASLNPGRFWPPLLAYIASGWVIAPVLIVLPTGWAGNPFHLQFGAMVVLAFVFCWLYERAARATLEPAVPPAGAFARALLPAGVFAILLVMQYTLPLLAPVRLSVGASGLAILVYTFLHILSPRRET